MMARASNNELECSEILCRLALNKKFIEAASVDAFLLRPSDNGKLSVCRLSKVSLAECARTFNRVFGSFSLHTGRIRDIAEPELRRLEIEIDESPDDPCPGHAAVLNLPDPQTAYEHAQRAASLLKRISRKLS